MDEYQGLQSCQQGDVGISIIVAVVDPNEEPVDLRTASAKVIRLGLPDGTSVDYAAAFLTDGSDGQLVYVTVADDLAQVGEYELQGIVTISGAVKSTAVSTIQVRENISEPIVPEP